MIVSTGRKSTPRSRLAVQTTAFKFPVCRLSSIHVRNSLSIEPWCSAIDPAISGYTSSNFWYHVSLIPLVLIKMRVVLLCSIIGISLSASLIPKCPAHGYFSISSGIIDSTIISFFNPAFTIIPYSPSPLGEGVGG